MPQLFERRDVFGNSPAVWILSALLFAAPLGWWSLSHVERRDDVGMWLPPGDPTRQTLEWAAESFPIQRDLLVTWTGSSVNDPRVAAFRERLEPVRDEHGVLRGGQPHIASVSNPRAMLQQMFDRDVPSAEAVQRLTGSALGRGPLCVRLTEEGRNKQRRMQADMPVVAERKWGIELRVSTPNSSALQSLPAEVEPIDPLEFDPVEISTDGSLRAIVEPTHDLEIAWSGVDDGEFIEWLKHFEPDGGRTEIPLIADVFFLPGSPVALDVIFSEAGRADRAETLQRVRDAAVAVGVPLTELRITGPAVVEADLQRATQHAGWNPAFPWQQFQRRSALLTSIIAAVLMTILVLRDLRLIVITLAASAVTVFATLALLPVAGADLTVFLFAIPVMTGAVALSGAMHIARQWQSAQLTDESGAVQEASRRTFSPALASTWMMSLAVLVWCVSPLPPMRDWSEGTSVALIAGFLIVNFGVPALLLLWRDRTTALPHDPALWHALGSICTRHPWAQATAILFLVVAASYGMRYADPQIDLAQGLPGDSSWQTSVGMVEGQVGGTIDAETIIRFDARSQDERDLLARMELIREVGQQLRHHPAVSGCLSWADFFPVVTPLDPDASRLEATRRARSVQTMMYDWREGDQRSFATPYYTVAKADRDADMDGDRGYSHHGDEFWRISARVRWTHVAALAQTQRELDDTIQAVLKAAPGTRHRITGPLAIQSHTERMAFRSFLIASAIAVGLIAVTFIITLQHVGAALLALLPCVAPSTAVLGIWSYCGGRLDFSAMLSAGLSVGLSAGQVLPLLWSFREALNSGRTRPEAIAAMLSHAGPHAWRTAWIVGVTILPLSTCEAAIIGHFGFMLPLMIGTAVLLQLIWVPQLLAGPLGTCFTTPSVSAASESVVEPATVPATNRAA